MKAIKKKFSILIFFFPFYLIAFPLYRQPIKRGMPQIENNQVWVFFTDKGFQTEKEYKALMEKVSFPLPLAVIEKRLIRMGEPYNFYDLPVCERYIEEIVARGGRLRSVSNWLNAASFELDKSLIPEIYSLPFVYEIKPLKAITFSVQEGERINAEDSLIYGLSYRQLALLGVNYWPAVPSPDRWGWCGCWPRPGR